MRIVDLWVRKCAKTAAILFRSPRDFAPAVCAREIIIMTHKFTPLSTLCVANGSQRGCVNPALGGLPPPA